jgi:hypothetical protein
MHLIAVNREDLLLRVTLLDLHRQQQFLHLAFPGLLVGEEQLAGELLGQRAGAVHPPVDDVLHGGHDDSRDAQPEVLIELVVFCGQDRLLEFGRDAFVRNDLAALDRELTDDFATRAMGRAKSCWARSRQAQKWPADRRRTRT